MISGCPARMPGLRRRPMEYAMVIDGRPVTTGQWDDVINPAKGEPFAQCPRGTRANVDEAVDAAARAFKTWRKDEAVRRQALVKDRKSTRLNSSHIQKSRMPSSA